MHSSIGLPPKRPDWRRVFGIFLLALALAGCQTPGEHRTALPRPFNFEEDTFAYPNELRWEYHFDPATGATTHSRRNPPATYSQHCFVVARSARQFFQHARFDPTRPPVDEDAYRRLIRKVISTSPRKQLLPEERIVIPGYAHLRDFSEAHEELLKEECGSAWQSYFQRGHWRMIFLLTRDHQERIASQLTESIGKNWPAVVHVVRFPQLSINHAMVVFDCTETADAIEFATYDPNSPESPVPLVYDRARRRFSLSRNAYFAGGRVDVYEIYHEWNY